MKCIVGQKQEMTQIFTDQGERLSVTPIKSTDCFVVQLKNKEKDGYQAIKVAYDRRNKISKPASGINAAAKTEKLSHFQEFRADELDGYKTGQALKVDLFVVGDMVDAQGVSKGKGYQGVVKRHHFAGSPATHGHKDQLRKSGSIGPGYPQRVFKGKRMAGHMGHEQVTVKNLKVVKVDAQNSTLYVQGGVPGPTKGWISICSIA